MILIEQEIDNTVEELRERANSFGPTPEHDRALMDRAAGIIDELTKELAAAKADIRSVLRDEADCCQICDCYDKCMPGGVHFCNKAEWKGLKPTIATI